MPLLVGGGKKAGFTCGAGGGAPGGGPGRCGGGASVRGGPSGPGGRGGKGPGGGGGPCCGGGGPGGGRSLELEVEGQEEVDPVEAAQRLSRKENWWWRAISSIRRPS